MPVTAHGAPLSILQPSPFMESTILLAPALTPAHVSPAAPAPAAAACANCHAPRTGEYCHACGQQFQEDRLTVRGLVMDFIVCKLGLENGLLRTLVDLTLRPAAMIRGYVDGRRQPYVDPVTHVLLVASTYLMLQGVWIDTLAAGSRADAMEMDAEMGEAFVQIQLYTDTHPGLLALAICLFLVPMLRLLFRKSTRAAEVAVFTLYVSAHLVLMQMVINLAAILLAADPYAVMTGWVINLPSLVYVFLAGRFFGTRFSSYLRMGVAVAFAIVGLLAVMTIASIAMTA